MDVCTSFSLHAVVPYFLFLFVLQHTWIEPGRRPHYGSENFLIISDQGRFSSLLNFSRRPSSFVGRSRPFPDYCWASPRSY
ncbi:hypothetical protein BDV37DRAFT_246211 [Aspergillus pseudonomiae]|uniref:Uncharacterized protein n=1 Tax=Aspergillus pseudonomiae TaxID=1506151 RepID=A0A5N7DF11_9EURO|nr:uncharacterized protein BDV37DRAFT_246211 [Aspergillus pseudonomiae]KAE8404990.1 hypothetical protein BDV37DRAFT_246211 [Aspergillus pseudonomiae]